MTRTGVALLAAAAALAVSVGTAQAGYDTGSFSFTVTTGNTSGNGFSAVKGATPFASSPAPVTATFTYTGALGFDNTAAQNSGSGGDLNSTFFASAGNTAPNYGISGYSGSGTFAPANASFGTVGGFIAASGSASGFLYGSFYTIDLGTVAAGTVLTITHDDGASVYQGSTEIGTTTPGPTTATTDTVTITSTADTTLYYSRQNGTPSILEVSVPEPASLALLGAGLAALGLVRRRQSRRAVS